MPSPTLTLCSPATIYTHPLQDKDGLRKEEVAALSGPNELAEFYNRLKQIKEFHKKHPNEVSHLFLLQYCSHFALLTLLAVLG